MSRSLGLIRAVTSSWLSLIVLVATQLVQVPVALAHLTGEEFGLYGVLSQFLATLMFADLGVSFAFGRLLIDGRAGGPDKYQEIWSSGLLLCLFQAGIVATVILGATPWVVPFFKVPTALAVEARAVFLALGAIQVVRYALNIYPLALFAGQRIATTNALQTISAVLQFASFIVAIRAGLRLWAYVISIGLSTAFLCVASIWVCRSAGLTSGWTFQRASRAQVWSIFRLGLDVFFSSSFNLFMANSLLLFAGFLFSLQTVAVFSVNLKLHQMLVQILQRAPGAAEPSLMELVSHNDLPRFRFGWGVIAKATLAATICGSGCFYLLAPTVVSWWAGPEMVMGTATVAWLALASLRLMLHYFLVGTLVMFKEIRRVRWVMLLEAAVYCGLAVILGKRFGLSGLLAAFVMSLLAGAIWRGSRELTRLAGMEPRFLAALTLRTCILPLTAFCTLVLLGLGKPGTGWGELSAQTLGWCLLNAACFFFVTLRSDERQHLRSLCEQVFVRRSLRKPLILGP